MPTVAWPANVESRRPPSRRAFDLHHESSVAVGSSVGGCSGSAATVRVLGSQRAVCLQALWGLHSSSCVRFLWTLLVEEVVRFRSAIRELEAGRCVLIFPEGRRTEDGYMARFRGGVLLSRERPMPRWSHWPSMGRGTLGAGTASCCQRSHRYADWRTNSRRGPEAMEEAEALEHLKREVEKLRLEVRGSATATRGLGPSRDWATCRIGLNRMQTLGDFT